MFGSVFRRKHFKKKGDDLEQVLRDVIGLVVMCEDHVLRTVHNACTPVKKEAAQNGLIIINEGDPKAPSGHWVTLLAVKCAIDGMPQPDKEQREAFRRIAQATRSTNLEKIYQANRTGKMPFDLEK